MLIINVVLLTHACIIDDHTAFSAFVASVGCILSWIVVRFI